MTHQEIYDFFKKNGNNKHFIITDTPIANIGILEGHTFTIRHEGVRTEPILNLTEFINNNLTDKYSTVYIYSEQDFKDDMKYVRYYKYIPDKLITRSLKIKKIKDNMK